MKKYLFIYTLLILCKISFGQIPEKPSHNSYVYDYTNALTTAQNNNLRHLLYQFDSITNNQIVIVLTQKLSGIPIENYSIELAESWGIGVDVKDNGILICASILDKKIRIEFGYGLEHLITDFWSSKHLREDITPNFKERNYYGGLYSLLQNMCLEIDSDIIFPEIDSELLNQRSPIHATPLKPKPFTHLIDDANLFSTSEKKELENHISEISKEHGIPIHYYFYNKEETEYGQMLDYAYDIAADWDFPITLILSDEDEDKHNGLLVFYNTYTNNATAIAGDGYKDELSLTTLSSIVSSSLVNSKESLLNRVKLNSIELAETYTSEYWNFIFMFGGVFLGIIFIIVLGIVFGGNSSSSGRTYSNRKTTIWDNDSSSTSYSNGDSGSFSGGSFGGGGATGSW